MERSGNSAGAKELKAARRESFGLIVAFFIFSVVVNLLMLTGPLYILHVYDRVFCSGSEATLVALSALVIFLFLRRFVATVIPTLSLPVSLVGAVALLWGLNYSLDNISLLGLTLAYAYTLAPPRWQGLLMLLAVAGQAVHLRPVGGKHRRAAGPPVAP